MFLKDKLQIVLITYNREKNLENTFKQIFSDHSPIRNFDITVLDNASTDGTENLIKRYQQNFPNLKHVIHPRNIGGNANICRAFELGVISGKEYLWILCDDDGYDFNNWAEVETAIQKQVDIVCLSNYAFPTEAAQADPAYQIFQLTFVPAGIYKTSLITDTVLTNMYDAIYTMFQQSCLTISVINKGGKIHVCSKPLVFNGFHVENNNLDMSYTRGLNSKDCIARRRDQVWVVGYTNILSLLKNNTLFRRCLEVAIPAENIYNSWGNFYKSFFPLFFNRDKFHYFYEVWRFLPKKRKYEFALHMPKIIFKFLLKFIFSFRNSRDKKYKIMTVFGFKFKFKRSIKRYTIDDIQIFLITHNRANLITYSLDSLLNQNVPVKEITVLDNESVDDTERIVQEYSKTHDNKVKYVKTFGHLGNYHMAKKLVSKDYCMLFHDDDILNPGYLKYAVNLLNRYDNVSLITTPYTEFRTDKPTIQKVSDAHYLFKKQNEFARYMYFREVIAYATAIYKSRFFVEEDLEYQKFSKFNDWPLMVKMAAHGQSILFKDCNMFYVRRHDGQDTWTSTNTPSISQIINWDKFFYEVFKKFKDKKALQNFPIKALYFLKGKYDSFISPEDRKKYSFPMVVKKANQCGLPLSTEDANRMNDRSFKSYIASLGERKSLFSKVSPVVIYRTQKGLTLKLFYKIKIRIWNNKWFARNNKKPAN